MNPVQLDLPDGCEVYNFLYPTRDPEYLVQDQLSVALPNGYVIDVTWAPEHDPNGSYIVRVFREYWQAQQVPSVITRDVNDVVNLVREHVLRFIRPEVALSSSGVCETEARLEHVS